MHVVVAGGGVAGLEALLALRTLAGDRIDLTLVAADPEFTYRPLAVAEPFALGHAYRVPLSQFTEDAGAALVIDSTIGVDDPGGEVRLRLAREAKLKVKAVLADALLERARALKRRQRR